MGSTFVFSLAGIPGNKLVVVCSVYKRLGKKKKKTADFEYEFRSFICKY